MNSMLQLDPAIPVVTPAGNALAHVLIDYGVEHDLLWVCFREVDGEIWTYRNQDVRAVPNLTFGRKM